MATSTITLLPTTTFGTAVGNYDGSSASFSSDKVKGDGYYGFSDGVHTVFWRVLNFVGTVRIQGTLAKDPAETDWFDCNLLTADDNYTVTTDGLAVLNTVTSREYTTATTESRVYNIKANLVWLRITITGFTAGTITTAQLAH